MRINPVISTQYYVQPTKNSNNKRPASTTSCKSNDIAFSSNFFSNLGAKIDRYLTKEAAKIKQLPGSYDDEFHKLLQQTKYGDGVPLITNLKDGTISSSKEHKEAVKKTLDSMPESCGDVIRSLKRALEIIEENTKKSQNKL